MASSPGRYLVLLGIASAVLAAGVMREDVPRSEDGFYAVSTIDDQYTFPTPPSNSQSVAVLTNLHRTEPQIFRLTSSGTTAVGNLQLLYPKENEPASSWSQQDKAVLHRGHHIDGDDIALKREFRVHTGGGPLDDPRFFGSITAACVGSNSEVAVYLHPAAEPPDSFRLSELMEVVAAKISVVTQLLDCEIPDLDSNGKFSVLLVPRPEPRSPTAFVCPADYDTTADSIGNQADMMYVSSDIPALPVLDAIVAHELAHVVRCCSPAGLHEEDWLHEGFAHAVEQVASDARQNIDHRISRYLEHPERYSLVVPSYLAAGLFRDHGSRGATASFLSVLMRTHGEQQSLRRLVASGLVGANNVANATGNRFESTFRNWTQQTISESPRIEGDFVLIGPKCIEWDGHADMELEVMPSSTVFVDVSSARNSFVVRSDSLRSSQASISVRRKNKRLELSVERTDDGLLVRTAALPPNAVRCVVGVETTKNGRSVAIGRKTFTSLSTPIEAFFTLKAAKDRLLIKAFVECEDGRFQTGRALSEFQSTQLGSTARIQLIR
ncbi:MAG: hypothetical protein AB8G99_01895 [Planctomycetaceae bacterium]